MNFQNIQHLGKILIAFIYIYIYFADLQYTYICIYLVTDRCIMLYLQHNEKYTDWNKINITKRLCAPMNSLRIASFSKKNHYCWVHTSEKSG